MTDHAHSSNWGHRAWRQASRATSGRIFRYRKTQCGKTVNTALQVVHWMRQMVRPPRRERDNASDGDIRHHDRLPCGGVESRLLVLKIDSDGTARVGVAACFMCHPQVLRSHQRTRYNGGNTEISRQS